MARKSSLCFFQYAFVIESTWSQHNLHPKSMQMTKIYYNQVRAIEQTQELNCSHEPEYSELLNLITANICAKLYLYFSSIRIQVLRTFLGTFLDVTGILFSPVGLLNCGGAASPPFLSHLANQDANNISNPVMSGETLGT